MTFREHDSTVFVGSEDNTREEGKIAGYSKIGNDETSYLVVAKDGNSNRWVKESECFDTQYVPPPQEGQDDA